MRPVETAEKPTSTRVAAEPNWDTLKSSSAKRNLRRRKTSSASPQTRFTPAPIKGAEFWRTWFNKGEKIKTGKKIREDTEIKISVGLGSLLSTLRHQECWTAGLRPPDISRYSQLRLQTLGQFPVSTRRKERRGRTNTRQEAQKPAPAETWRF